MNFRSEGVCPRNGLCDSCACGCVAGVVSSPGSAGRPGFVVIARRAGSVAVVRSPGGGVRRGAFQAVGPSGKCSPRRDLQHAPCNLCLKPPFPMEKKT